jgi:rhomboid family GlyGly-CTERM serine protease
MSNQENEGLQGAEDSSRRPPQAVVLSRLHPGLRVAAVATLIILTLQAIPGSQAWLRLERELLLEPMEFVRLFGAHLVHLGWRHAILNLAGLWLVAWYLGPSFGVGRWLLSAGLAAIAVDVGIGVLNPELGWYVGLSGVLHGVLIAGLIVGGSIPAWERILMLGLVAAKIAWEQFSGPVPGSEMVSGGTVIVDAHLYGAIGGGFAAGVLMLRSRQQARSGD